MNPKLSIITINYNNLPGLERTAQSVWKQQWQQFEFIVIDGGSSDGSCEFLEENTGNITYWISERDGGVFNAQNKGWKRAKGEYLLFLNSGDALFSSDTLTAVSPYLDGTDIVYGGLLIEESNNEWLKPYDKPLSLHYFYWDTLPHQGSFIKRKLLDNQAGYDERLRLVSDWKFFLTAVCRYNATTKRIDFAVARYNLDGISAQEANKKRLWAEKEKIWAEEWPAQYRTVKAFLELQDKNGQLRKKLHQATDSAVIRLYRKVRRLFIL